LAEQNRERVDPLDLSQWRFFVIRTPKINELYGNQKTVALTRLSPVCNPVSFEDLKAEVDIVLFDSLPPSP